MKTETLRHQEAFNHYYSLGETRSIPKVAREYSVSEAAVKKWSRAFGWQARIEQRDIENARRLEQKTNTVVVNAKAQYRQIIRAAIGRWVEHFRAQKVPIGSIMDLERLVKLDLLLMGEATERSEHDLSNLSDAEIDARLAKILTAGGQEGGLGAAVGTGAAAGPPDPAGLDDEAPKD
jgi:hypothetical protein